MYLTYRYRIKDATMGKHLAAHARTVNYVWNYCCEVQRHAQAWRKKWPTWIDLHKLTSGTSVELNIHSDTIGAICKQFHKSTRQRGMVPKWRGRKSLGWVPVCNSRAISLKGDAIVYLKRRYRVWLSRVMDGKIKTASFSQDARGRWYINLVCEVEAVPSTGVGEVGIDLGLKTLAALSDGTVIANPRQFAKHESALAVAQRARKKRRVQAIHAKIENTRRHFLHEQSTRIVRTYAKIVVGNVNAAGLTQTTMAKSVLDAGWSTFRYMLAYKAIRHGREFVEADERNSTRTCSACGARSGPKGTAGLGIREWACSKCGTVHDRDVNAARNILGAVRRPPAEGIAA